MVTVILVALLLSVAYVVYRLYFSKLPKIEAAVAAVETKVESEVIGAVTEVETKL